MLLSLKLNLIVDIRQGHGKSVHLYFSGLQVIFVAAMFFVISSIEQFDGKFMRTFLLVNLVTDGKVCQEYRCEVLAVCSCLIVLYLLVWMCQDRVRHQFGRKLRDHWYRAYSNVGIKIQ